MQGSDWPCCLVAVHIPAEPSHCSTEPTTSSLKLQTETCLKGSHWPWMNAGYSLALLHLLEMQTANIFEGHPASSHCGHARRLYTCIIEKAHDLAHTLATCWEAASRLGSAVLSEQPDSHLSHSLL